MKDDEELVVVWAGGPLLPERSQHPDPTWTGPKRVYNRKSPDLERKGTGKDKDNGE